MIDDGSVLYYIGDIPVREKNYVRLCLNESEYKRIAETADQTGLPVAFIIASQGQACKICGNDKITIVIPKNLLSIKKSNTGRSTTTRLKNDKQE